MQQTFFTCWIVLPAQIFTLSKAMLRFGAGGFSPSSSAEKRPELYSKAYLDLNRCTFSGDLLSFSHPASHLMPPSSRGWTDFLRRKQLGKLLGRHWVMRLQHTTPSHLRLPNTACQPCQASSWHIRRATRCGFLKQAPHQRELKSTNTSLLTEACRHSE